MGESVRKFFCSRLLDYVIMVGPRAVTSERADGNTSPSLGGHTHIPHLLRRYPPQDHEDFSLPPDVVIFCQPEGCDHQEAIPNSYNNPSQTTNSFVFLLTEKDTSRIRYGICLNFYRPLQKYPTKNNPMSTNQNDHQHDNHQENNYNELEQHECEHTDKKSNHFEERNNCDSLIMNQSNNHQFQSQLNKQKQKARKSRSTTPSNSKQKVTYALHSICIISHHPFFSTFRECLVNIRKFIHACEDKNIMQNIHYLSQHQQEQNLNQYHHKKQNIPHHDEQVTSATVTRITSYTRCKCHHIHKHIPQHYRTATGHRMDCPYSNPIWSLLTMPHIDESAFSSSTLDDIAEIESWLLRLLSVPVPIPEKTKIELEIMPLDLRSPLQFALPDHTRFSLIDFPLHLPLELLGVQTCLQVLTCILLEHKVALQSKDYNALSMSVMAFVTMIYPLEYMFPVIPLLPSCMSSAEQLLLAPTPFIIGFPSSFFKFKYNFTLPNDVWIVDLDTNKVIKPLDVESLPPLPAHEGSILIQNLQKILNTMSGIDTTIVTSEMIAKQLDYSFNTPTHRSSNFNTNRQSKIIEESSSKPSSPFRSRRSSMAAAGQLLQMAANKISGSNVSSGGGSKSSSPSSSLRPSVSIPVAPAFDPLTIIHNDADAVDVAVRVAMVRFFNSHEVLANFIEHTRTIRLYPRPVVSFQKSSFLQSRSSPSQFLMKLVETQAVEYMAEWALCPDNVAFQRIQTGVYDPCIIGDKPKWYGNQLDPLRYQIWDESKSEFYQKIVLLIQDSNNMNERLDSSSRFSDYYDNEEDEKSSLAADGYDNVNHLMVANDHHDHHSPYISSNDSSPCYASDDDDDDDNQADNSTRDGRLKTLDDVMNSRLRSSSTSSSITSNESWNNEHIRNSIPADYRHDIGDFPPIRCDLSKNYRPPTKLITCLDDHDGQTKENIGSSNSKVNHSDNSSEDDDDDDENDDDENDSSKLAPSTSSCENSKTEEFDFGSVEPKTPEEIDSNLTNDRVVKLFESVDSDTMVPAKQVSSSSMDTNNNVAPPCAKLCSEFDSLDTLSVSSGVDTHNNQNSQSTGSGPPISTYTTTITIAPQQTTINKSGPTITNSDRKFSESFVTSEGVNVILNAQKAKVSSGMAKLIDRASSITESIKQGSGSTSPLTKNLAGEQVGTLIDKFTKEAKVLISAGANDVGRQKLLKNIQNLGEVFFEERSNDGGNGGKKMDENLVINSHSAQQKRKSTLGQLSGNSDFNDITDKATSIGGWLGSKASGFANRMRDRAKPLGPFPTSKLTIQM